MVCFGSAISHRCTSMAARLGLLHDRKKKGDKPDMRFRCWCGYEVENDDATYVKRKSLAHVRKHVQDATRKDVEVTVLRLKRT